MARVAGVVVLLCAIAISLSLSSPLSPSLPGAGVKTPATRFGDTTFECGWRAVAYDFGRNLAPSQGAFTTLFDALQLHTLCGVTRPTSDAPSSPSSSSSSGAGEASATAKRMGLYGLEVYVDPVHGSDSNPGTVSQPVQTVGAAVALSRSAASDKAVVLRQGTHFLNQTVHLGPQDNTLAIVGYPGEEAVVSGGIPLTVSWTPYNVTPGTSCPNNICMYYGQNAVYGSAPGPNVVNFTRTDTPQQCRDLCAAHPECKSFTWHDVIYPIEWNRTCWFKLDSIYSPTQEDHHYSGCKLNEGVQGCVDSGLRNVYVASLAGQSVGNMEGLHFMTADGQLHRAIRARYPNSDPEYIPAYLTQGDWHPPTSPGCNSQVVDYLFPDNYPGMFQDFRLGVGGTCDVYEVDPSSYWCQPDGRTGGKTYCVRSPSGITVNETTLPNMPYHTPSGAVISAWRGSGEWFTWFWQVAGYDPTSGAFTFGRGGFHGAEGSDKGGRWYIENVFEELDAPDEYFYDPVSQKLYYYYNGTGAPPASIVFAAANLTQLFVLRGSEEAPVLNVSFSNIKFTGTAPTMFAPHGVPSGGDWALEPQGALTFIGTVGTTVSGCTFERLDGNAVFVGGFNRNVTVKDSEFSFIGNNAVALWGNTNYYDGTNGDHPRFTTMQGCVCREIGHYEKQSSCFFQAKSSRSLVQGNVMFNMPRAAININDGFGGGNLITDNLVFNTCRESSDHGPFNSWDRQPFLTIEKDGITPSLEPAYNTISFNLMVANYGADGGCIDNDDGSSWYNIHDNFFVYGGHKSDFDGHCKRSYNNVMLYPNVYGARCIGVFGMPHPGFEEGFWNNTCVLQNPNGVYANLGGCALNNPTTWTLIAHDNRLYSPDGTVQVQCGPSVSLAEWQQKTGRDTGTAIGSMPTVAEMMLWGRRVLHWN